MRFMLFFPCIPFKFTYIINCYHIFIECLFTLNHVLINSTLTTLLSDKWTVYSGRGYKPGLLPVIPILLLWLWVEYHTGNGKWGQMRRVLCMWDARSCTSCGGFTRLVWLGDSCEWQSSREAYTWPAYLASAITKGQLGVLPERVY